MLLFVAIFVVYLFFFANWELKMIYRRSEEQVKVNTIRNLHLYVLIFRTNSFCFNCQLLYFHKQEV